tara:strand:- start:1235 stop:2950 length:1716 start_codon:yes stop_codon:yes gene_type:complete
MSKLINNLLESSASGWRSMQGDAARLAGKWAKTGLLEGIDGEVERNNMAMILENQAKQLVVEQSSTQAGAGSSAFTANAGNGANWAGIALPLVRKVFGQISSKEFVSVQPMNLPSGLVFFLDFQYGGTSDAVNKPFGVGGDVFGSGSMYGLTDGATDPTGGLYGAGRFGYSLNQFSSSAQAITSGSTSTYAVNNLSPAVWADVQYSSELSASAAAGTLSKVVVSASLVPDFDAKGVRAFVLTSGSTQTALGSALPKYTTTREDEQKIVFVFNAEAGTLTTVNGDMNVFYNKQPQDNSRGDFEDASGAGRLNARSVSSDALNIPQVDVKLKSEGIIAKTRKLKAQWTPEFAQDLNAYQALDAEAELTSIMSEYIALEIDLEILDMLIQDASAADEYWYAQNNRVLNSDKNGFDDANFFNTQGQWFQTLGTKMQKVSNKIHQKTLRGGANFVVTSPTVATILESIPGFASAGNGDAAQATYAFGIQKVGQLNNRYTVYKNPYMTEGLILMGYRGSQFLETGATFAPYIPLIMTPLVYDPDTFTPRKGLLTRYAKKMIRPEFYGRIFVNDLNQL